MVCGGTLWTKLFRLPFAAAECSPCSAWCCGSCAAGRSWAAVTSIPSGNSCLQTRRRKSCEPTALCDTWLQRPAGAGRPDAHQHLLRLHRLLLQAVAADYVPYLRHHPHHCAGKPAPATAPASSSSMLQMQCASLRQPTCTHTFCSHQGSRPASTLLSPPAPQAVLVFYIFGKETKVATRIASYGKSSAVTVGNV